MRILLIYDIVNDKARTKVADLCLDYALQRVQYSAFMGDLSRTLTEELLLKVGRTLQGHEYDVQVIPICSTDWAARRVLVSRPKPAPDTDDDDGWV